MLHGPLALNIIIVVVFAQIHCKSIELLFSNHQMNEAAMAALEEKQDSIDQGIENINPWFIKTSHFEHALQKIKPSVAEKVCGNILLHKVDPSDYPSICPYLSSISACCWLYFGNNLFSVTHDHCRTNI